MGAHPVRLVPVAEWRFPGRSGITTDDVPSQPPGSIEIRLDDAAAAYRHTYLLHEFAHTLGLNHADPAFGPSILTPTPSSLHLEARDIVAAACALGCGPCDGDPYDG
jgi:hypothetical protein